jgi:hypothetical protein
MTGSFSKPHFISMELTMYVSLICRFVGISDWLNKYGISHLMFPFFSVFMFVLSIMVPCGACIEYVI